MKYSSKNLEIKPANITWRHDKTPESNEFKDIYFSPENGLAESQYVFIEGIGGQEFLTTQDNITIGETGFGTGLNFLNLWQYWDRKAQPHQRLHFISVEAFPLEHESLKKALTPWEELQPYTQKLLAQYPELHAGFHRLTFDQGRVTLTLIFGDISQALPLIQGKVNGWFLDGFSPAQNTGMWQKSVYQQLARLSHINTRIATFTAAGHVRRGLEEAGFHIQKRKGFGKKRECIQGYFTQCPQTSTQNPPVIRHEHAPLNPPWLQFPAPPKKAKRIAIIGGGIAGLTIAQSMLQRNFHCSLFEARHDVATVGSGNMIGLIQPRLTAADSLDGRFNASAFLHATRYYDQQEQLNLPDFDNSAVWMGERGVLQIAKTPEEEIRFEKLTKNNRLPKTIMHYISPDKASEIANCHIERSCLYFPTGGMISPQEFVTDRINQLTRHTRKQKPLEVYLNHKISSLKQQSDDKWSLLGDNVQGAFCLSEFDIIIIAAGPFANQIFNTWEVPLHAKRGQIEYIPATKQSLKLSNALSSERYLTPAISTLDHAYHIAGASYANFPQNPPAEFGKEEAEWRQLRTKDGQEIAEDLVKLSPELSLQASKKGRAGLRATVPDHLAIIGPLPDKDYFNKTYHDLHHGKKASLYPSAKYHAGLYCFTGLGSRGLQTAPLLAEALSDLITDEPNALPKDILNELHPARFQVRRLKKRPT